VKHLAVLAVIYNKRKGVGVDPPGNPRVNNSNGTVSPITKKY